MKAAYLLLMAAYILPAACKKSVAQQDKTGTLKITFINTVKGNPVGLGSTVHTNPFGETYTITKFKYYVSNVTVNGPAVVAEKESYHLIDESNPASLSFSFTLKTNSYNAVQFLLGVDSLHNVSGAQTGALDPLNDMFWTWNSGYVMAKMEGTSPQSTQVNNKVEYHIGGFSGTNSALKNISIPLSAAQLIDIKEGRISEVIIEADFNKWWQTPNDLKISVTPVCNTPGALAKSVADNYSDMFSLRSVTNN